MERFVFGIFNSIILGIIAGLLLGFTYCFIRNDSISLVFETLLYFLVI